jgi:hypothetical protein
LEGRGPFLSLRPLPTLHTVAVETSRSKQLPDHTPANQNLIFGDESIKMILLIPTAKIVRIFGDIEHEYGQASDRR